MKRVEGRMSSPARRKRRGAIDAAMVLIILLLMVQMWLLTAALESFLAFNSIPAPPNHTLIWAKCISSILPALN